MNDNKRILVCLPNQPNISGVVTIECAKAIAKEKCPNENETVSILVLDGSNNNQELYCLERKNGEWEEKEFLEKILSPFKN